MSFDSVIDGSVASLTYYPVKSLAGIGVDQAVLTRRGLLHDRRWMLVRESGRLITQREEHRLALLSVEVENDGFRITSPGGESTILPVAPLSDQTMTVSVWKDEVIALVGPHDARNFFSSYLEFPCLPVFMPEEADRKAGSRAPDDTPLSFADAYPGLLISEASLADLNARASIPLVMRRFRPNVVVSGTLPYAEDTWFRISLGSAGVSCVKACSRCVLTTVNPDTGTTGKEPLQTLAVYRRKDHEVYFGQNFVVDTVGIVRVGDRVSVIEQKEPIFPSTS